MELNKEKTNVYRKKIKRILNNQENIKILNGKKFNVFQNFKNHLMNSSQHKINFTSQKFHQQNLDFFSLCAILKNLKDNFAKIWIFSNGSHRKVLKLNR